MLVLVVAAFALCWAPIHIFHLLVDAGAIGYHYQAFMVVSPDFYLFIFRKIKN